MHGHCWVYCGGSIVYECGSEPTPIYDPDTGTNQVWRAWRTRALPQQRRRWQQTI